MNEILGYGIVSTHDPWSNWRSVPSAKSSRQGTGEGGARQFLFQCSKLTHIPNALTIPENEHHSNSGAHVFLGNLRTLSPMFIQYVFSINWNWLLSPFGIIDWHVQHVFSWFTCNIYIYTIISGGHIGQINPIVINADISQFPHAKFALVYPQLVVSCCIPLWVPLDMYKIKRFIITGWWLSLPLWKICKSQLGWWNSQYMENKKCSKPPTRLKCHYLEQNHFSDTPVSVTTLTVIWPKRYLVKTCKNNNTQILKSTTLTGWWF